MGKSKSKFWQDSNSLDSKGLSTKSKKLAKIRRAEFEAEQRALQDWADAGFQSVPQVEVPNPDDE